MEIANVRFVGPRRTKPMPVGRLATNALDVDGSLVRANRRDGSMVVVMNGRGGIGNDGGKSSPL